MAFCGKYQAETHRACLRGTRQFLTPGWKNFVVRLFEGRIKDLQSKKYEKLTKRLSNRFSNDDAQALEGRLPQKYFNYFILQMCKVKNPKPALYVVQFLRPFEVIA